MTMKKILLIAALLVIYTSVNAQQAEGSFEIPTGSLSVSYYNDRSTGGQNGHLVITNNSETTITKAHIKVSVLIRWTELVNDFPIANKKTLILCDDDFTDIPKNQTIEKYSSKRGVVKGGPEKEGKTYTYSVDITDVTYNGVSFPTSGVQKSTPLNSGDELMYDQLKIGGVYCDQSITVDVYYNPSTQRCYANMTYPERINNMTIWRLDDNSGMYNAYISYNGCDTYFLTINLARW